MGLALDAIMALPFSREQFFDVFAQYNAATWPLPIGLIAVALASVAAVYVRHDWDRAIAWILALLWAWMAIGYHFAFFSRINPAAWVFGGAYLLAAGLFARHASTATLHFRHPVGVRHAAGIVLIAYSLVGYPIVGWLAGHAYPRIPTFGLPCPTTIFTLGMLLLATRPVPASLFLVPTAWSIVGTVAAVELGVIQDYGLPVAAVTAILLSARMRRGGTRRFLIGASLRDSARNR
jgi:hypothetical protein